MKSQVDVRQRILAENESRAAGIRERFAAQGTLVLNLISSPGSGKTTLLEETVRGFAPRHRMGVLVGDVATERDAARLQALQIPAYQILTGGACHLDARQITAALERIDTDELDFLFIENVGNLICPTAYELGEDFKVALLSVAEGDDKPFKYPAIFSRARATVITKADLLAHTAFDMQAVREQIQSLQPEGALLVTSTREAPGIDAWLDFLSGALAAKREAAGG
ncbi:MAG: hydrogenase nickel incorporation protein HypB [Candidatus Eisenbacteria bacterium]|nr:hydrogenase nickel incorporation protein HypB [Candidatus Eisenbacteria bacterium]